MTGIIPYFSYPSRRFLTVFPLFSLVSRLVPLALNHEVLVSNPLGLDNTFPLPVSSLISSPAVPVLTMPFSSTPINRHYSSLHASSLLGAPGEHALSK